MGLFNWGKKKNSAEQQINDAFTQFGEKTNEVRQPGKESRKESIQRAENARIAEVKKEQILEKMQTLRKTMYANSSFSDHSERLEDAISKLKRMMDNVDVAAMNSVDNFILKAVNDGINYCNRESWVGMGACIDIIEELINDRFQCGAWFKDPQYIKARLTSNQIYVEIKDLESRIATIQKRGADLKEKYYDPRFKAQQQSLGNEMVKLKTDREKLTERINNLNKENALLQQTISAIENKISTEMRDRNFDIQNQVDDVIEMQAEANARNYANEKMQDKLNNVGARHTDSALSVDGTLSNDSMSTPAINIEDLGF